MVPPLRAPADREAGVPLPPSCSKTGRQMAVGKSVAGMMILGPLVARRQPCDWGACTLAHTPKNRLAQEILRIRALTSESKRCPGHGEHRVVAPRIQRL